jgi:hypothetical protein
MLKFRLQSVRRHADDGRQLKASLEEVEAGGGVDDAVIVPRVDDGAEDSAEKFFVRRHYPKGS